MKTMKFVLPLYLKTSFTDKDKSLEEIKEIFRSQNKYDTDKIAVSKTVALLAQRNDGPKNDPTVFKFFFLSNDKTALQKMADDFNHKLFGNDPKKIDLLGARVYKNSDKGNFTV